MVKFGKTSVTLSLGTKPTWLTLQVHYNPVQLETWCQRVPCASGWVAKGRDKTSISDEVGMRAGWFDLLFWEKEKMKETQRRIARNTSPGKPLISHGIARLACAPLLRWALRFLAVRLVKISSTLRRNVQESQFFFPLTTFYGGSTRSTDAPCCLAAVLLFHRPDAPLCVRGLLHTMSFWFYKLLID